MSVRPIRRACDWSAAVIAILAVSSAVTVYLRDGSARFLAILTDDLGLFGWMLPNRPRSSVRIARKRADPSRRYTVTADETASIAMTAADQSKARRIGRTDIRFRLQDQRRKAEAAPAS